MYRFFLDTSLEISRNKNKIKTKKLSNKKIIAKCGFITGDPDIDAVSRLFGQLM